MATTMSNTEGSAVTLAQLPEKRKKPVKPTRILLHVFLIATALVWIIPIAGAMYSSFRPFNETVRDGYLSLPETLTLENYRNAWEQGGILSGYWNTFLILAPALILTLFFSSMVAFAATRYSWRFNVFFLVLFTAGNLLPAQIIICLLYTSPSPRDRTRSRMPSSA